MSVFDVEALRRHLSEAGRRAAALAFILFLACAATVTTNAQNTFTSGSTGADGAFAPTANQTIVVPESGVFNYTTYNIPSNVTITYARNNSNKPLTILTTGDVTIAGAINIDGKSGSSNGSGGYGGPGGFNGGAGGYGFDQSFAGVPGDGPGGGGGGGSTAGANPGNGGGGGFGTAGQNGYQTNAGQGGPRYGAVTVLPLIGGSGGAGGGASASDRGGAGGGGGGAILIASSGTVTVNGNIYARGGSGTSYQNAGGGGAGGAVRIIANTVLGSGAIHVSGGSGSGYSGTGRGGQGYVRVESYDYGNFNAATSPANIISFALPHPIVVSNAPQLRIASVGGVASPSAPLGSLQGVPDIVVPSTQANPMAVALEGANLPLGTVVSVTVTPSRGSRTTVQSTALAGSEAASTATASVTLPGGMSVISASAVIDLTTTTASNARPLMMDGERVDRIEVAATFGSASEVTYVTRSGRRIKRASE
ncbi:MAG TPA: hypothetical protein VM934_13285 [Pyrinomonadaceae bacterium]|jgi:hypothetical protein|nr:hypothetical protein [Pyrinomonadaceae bacterium]